MSVKVENLSQRVITETRWDKTQGDVDVEVDGIGCKRSPVFV